MTNIDWKQVEEWDRKYRLHNLSSSNEYQCIPIERTEGDYLIMPDGTRLLDCYNQLICVNAGQCHPKIQAAIREATERYGFLHQSFTSDYIAKAAKLLIEDILGTYQWAAKVDFSVSGSEAVEKAFIFAKLYKNRPDIVTREHAYHGWTMGAAGATRIRGFKCGLADPEKPDTTIKIPDHPPGGFIVAPAPLCWDCSLGYTYPECKKVQKILPCVFMTQRLIETWGYETIAAMITEPIFGVGSIVPPPEYLPQLVDMLHKHDILWICDEILTGFGKTGKWFAHQLFGDLKPDLMTVGKGFTSSALPAAGTVISHEIAEFFNKYRWTHVGTFHAHPLSMAAVCANLEVLIEEHACQSAQKAGEYFEQKLKGLQAKHKTLGQVSGAGVLWSLELVKNKETKERFVPEDRRTAYSGNVAEYPTSIISEKCFEKSVLLGGWQPNTIRLGFSVFVSKQDMDKALDALDYALYALDDLANS
jgi:taurine--2-oxoglutarate transaminase